MSTTLLWLRNDLRLADNPALHEAVNRGYPVIPVFVWAPDEVGEWAPGAASRWWLHHSLAALKADLVRHGSNLVIRKGASWGALKAMIGQTKATAVFWNRRYEPAAVARDAKIKEELRTLGIEAKSFNGSLLFEPWEIGNQSGEPFRVFTPFWKACLSAPPPGEPLPAPNQIPSPAEWCCTLDLAKLNLLPTVHWTSGMEAEWTPGEIGATRRVCEFVRGAMNFYGRNRDRPDLAGTSRLSPHIHFGEMSPRQIWHAACEWIANQSIPDAEAYLREIGWREFAHHLLYYFPQTPVEPMRPEFSTMPWRRDEDARLSWQRGRTGYPIVDAGMRQLWTTGWMHNRVRMIVASFLVKDLLIPWQEGAKWFWDTLVDADLANNTLGWQWTAGCGADAAPYFRVFNPILQGVKFDPLGDYVRRWVPELGSMPPEWIHKPWAAPAGVLNESGVLLGRTYPHPIVNHDEARKRALAAFAEIRKGR